jgi:leucine-rich repeat-containing G protein-coupled receptor 6
LLKQFELTDTNNQLVYLNLNGNRRIPFIGFINQILIVNNLKYFYASQVKNDAFENMNLSLFFNLKELDLSFNNLTYLTSYLVEYRNANLEKLFHQNTSLDFDLSFLNNYPNLKVIDLSFNKQIKFSGNFFFHDLSKLEVIKWSHANLNSRFIHSVFNFSNFPLLTSLDLSFNNLVHFFFNSSTYTIMPLQYLNLKNNSLNSININKFPFVKFLDLSNNYITSISYTNMITTVYLFNNLLSSMFFTALFGADFLDLSFNRIDLKPERSYYIHPKYLNLSNNNLEYLNDFFYVYGTSTSQMVDLNLSKNKLNSFANSSFRNLGNLQYLNLSFNQLSQIKNEYFATLSKLIKLDIRNNKLSMLENFSL